MSNDTEDKILNLLKKRREGLTIKEISESIDKHRHTVAKYLSKLKGEGKVAQRNIGSAKLFYLFEVLEEDDIEEDPTKNLKDKDYNRHILLFSTTFLIFVIALSNFGSITGFFMQPTYGQANITVSPRNEVPEILKLNRTSLKEIPLEFYPDFKEDKKILSSSLLLKGESDRNVQFGVFRNEEELCRLNTGKNEFNKRCNLNSIVENGSIPDNLTLRLRFEGSDVDVSETPMGLVISNKTGGKVKGKGKGKGPKKSEGPEKPERKGEEKTTTTRETTTTVEETTTTSSKETTTTVEETTTFMPTTIEETTTTQETTTTTQPVENETSVEEPGSETTTTIEGDNETSEETTTTQPLENDTIEETTSTTQPVENETQGIENETSVEEPENETTTTTLENITPPTINETNVTENVTEPANVSENRTNRTEEGNVTVIETTTTTQPTPGEFPRENKTNRSQVTTVELSEVKLLITYRKSKKENITNVTNETNITKPSINETVNETLPEVTPNVTNRTNITKIPSIDLMVENKTVGKNNNLTFTVNETSGREMIENVTLNIDNSSYLMMNDTERGKDYWIYEWEAFNETGNYTAVARAFDDSELLNTSSVDISIIEENITEVNITPTIDLNVTKDVLDRNENITFYVNETSGRELIENVTLGINETIYQMSNTTDKGKDYWSYGWSAFNETGNYTAVARAFDKNNSFLANSSLQIKITENLTNITNVTNITQYTILNLSMNDTVEKGKILEAKTHLYDSNRTPLKNKTINLFLDSESYGNNSTDINGTSHFNLNTSNITIGNHTLKASYFGNETLNLSSSYSEKVFEVIPRKNLTKNVTSLELEITGENVSLGEELTLKGRLTFNGSALPNQNLTFQMNESLIGHEETNQTGWSEAEINSSKLFNGIYQAEVTFDGNKTLNITGIRVNTSIKILPKLVQERARIGKPVRWRKVVRKRNPSNRSRKVNVSFEVPGEARGIDARERSFKVPGKPRKGVMSAEMEEQKLVERVRNISERRFRVERIEKSKEAGEYLKKGKGYKRLELEDRMEPNQTKEYEMKFETSSPEKVEKKTRNGKKITVYSNSSYHYYNVTASSSLPELKFKPKIYRLVKVRKDSIDENNAMKGSNITGNRTFNSNTLNTSPQNNALNRSSNSTNITENTTNTTINNTNTTQTITGNIIESKTFNQTLNNASVNSSSDNFTRNTTTTTTIESNQTRNTTNNNINFTPNETSNGTNTVEYVYKRIDVTNDPLYNVTYLDTNNNSRYDKIVWNIPKLSNETFEISLDILNVQSYPSLEGNWTVEFNTSGTANLTITPVNTTWSKDSENENLYDLKFLDLICGNESVNYTWINRTGGNSSVFVENYSCNKTGREISKVLTDDHHYLNFTFGSESQIARNLVTLNWSQYTETHFDSGSFSNVERVNTGDNAFIRLQSSGSTGTWSNTRDLGKNETMNIVGVDVWNTQSACSIDITVEEMNKGGSVTKSLTGGRSDSFTGLGLQDSDVRITITFGSSCADTEVVDGIELHVEGSNTCEIYDMDVEIRAGDNSTSTGWINTTYNSTPETCGGSPVTATETWTTDYFYCPQDGSYDIRARSYEVVEEAPNTTAWNTSDYFFDMYSCSGPSGLSAQGYSDISLDSELGNINLSWVDNAGKEEGFRIERSKNISTFSGVGNASRGDTTYIDSDLEDNFVYYYRTRAYGNGSYSTYSNIAPASTKDRTGPSSSNLTLIADNSSNEMNMSWEWGQDEIRPEVSNNGLVGRWMFEEGSGNKTEDNSGNENLGTLNGGPQWVNGIQGNYALKFDGSDDYVDAGNDSSLDITDEITLGAWIKLNGWTGDYQFWVTKSYQKAWAFGTNDGGPTRYYINSTDDRQAISGNTNMELGKWYHIVMTYDSDTRKLKGYVNGESDLTYTLSGTGPINTNDRPVEIGGSNVQNRFWVNGSIDDVRIYDRALSQKEIRRMSLVGQWHFDEGSGEKAYDATGFGNDGFLKDENTSNSDGDTPPQWVDGIHGEALNFDGVDDYMKVNNSQSLNITEEVSLELWVKDPPFTGENWTGNSYISNSNQENSIGGRRPVKIEESSSSHGKMVTVSSRGDSHIYNISTSTSIPETTKKPSIYKMIDGEKIDITQDPRYDVTYVDTDNNGKYDKVKWRIPELSEKTFLVDITIINIQSYPTVGGNWTVRFNTTGTADLRITPINGTSWRDSGNESTDLEFLQVKCGNESLDYRWIKGNSGSSTVLVENYSCEVRGREVSKVLTDGKHYLKFRFGTDSGIAENTAFNTTSKSEWKNGTLHHTEADSSPGDLKLGSKNYSDESLAGFWRLSEEVAGDGGTVQDYSGNNNDGTTHNGTTTGVDGIRNSTAFDFDGSDDGVSVNSIKLSDFHNYGEGTVSLWWKASSINYAGTGGCSDQEDTLFSTRCNENSVFFDSNNKLMFSLYDGSRHTVESTTSNFQTGEWYHITVTYGTSNGMEIWLNGNLENTNSYTGAPRSKTGSEDKFWVGRVDPYWDTDTFNGTIDDVRIYDRSLTPSEIKNLYSSSPGYYTSEFMDAGSSTTWPELSWSETLESGIDLEGRVHSADSMDVTDTESDWNKGTGNWKYRKPITITENSGNNLNNYQVNLTIDTASLISNGKMQSDCGDMRFYDPSGGSLDYWIESGCDTSSTTVWVKVPSIPASSSETIYMYYGNEGATDGESSIGTSSLPAYSCRLISEQGDSTGDGNYYIDPDGGEIGNKFQVYCDMSTGNSGWLKVSFSNAGGEGIWAHSYSDSNDIFKCGGDESKYLGGGTLNEDEEDWIAGCTDCGNTFDLDYKSGSNSLTETQEDSIRQNMNPDTLSTTTRFAGYSCDDDAGSANDHDAILHNGSGNTWTMQDGYINNSAQWGWWVIDGRDSGDNTYETSSDFLSTDTSRTVPSNFVFPAEDEMWVGSGGGQAWGFEEGYILIKESSGMFSDTKTSKTIGSEKIPNKAYSLGNSDSYTSQWFSGDKNWIQWKQKGGQPIKPLSQWKMDEGSGQTASDSVGDNDGTLHGNPQWVDGVYDGALEFDGDGDCVEVPSSQSLNFTEEITIEGWVYRKGETGDEMTVAEKNGAYYLNIGPDNKLQFYWYGLSDPGYHDSPNTIPLNRWTHVAATYDGSYVRLFEDGDLVKQVAVTGTGDKDPAPLGIGCNSDGTDSREMNGTLDNIHLYDRALSSSEIQSLYHSTSSSWKPTSLQVRASQFNPEDPNLVGSWSFEGTGRKVIDSSGNSNTGTIGPFIQNGDFSTGDWTGWNYHAGDHWMGGWPDDGSCQTPSDDGDGICSYPASNTTILSSGMGDAVCSPLSGCPTPVLGDGNLNLDGGSDGGYNGNIYSDSFRVPNSGGKIYLHWWMNLLGRSSDGGRYDGNNRFYGTSSSYSAFEGEGVYWAVFNDNGCDGIDDDDTVIDYSVCGNDNCDSTPSITGERKVDMSNYKGECAYVYFQQMNAGGGDDGLIQVDDVYWVKEDPQRVSGYSGQGMEFDGSDDYVFTDDSDELDLQNGNLTLSGWIKVPTDYTPSNHRMVTEKCQGKFFWSGDCSGWGVAMDTGGDIYGGINNVSDTKWEVGHNGETDIRDNEWHFFTLNIKNGEEMVFYLDAKEENSTNIPNLDLNSNVGLEIGASADEETRFINAAIDQVHIYNRSLSASEISALYNLSDFTPVMENKYGERFDVNNTNLDGEKFDENYYQYKINMLSGTSKSVPKVDKVWLANVSDWSSWVSDPSGSSISVAENRYAQVQYNFSSTGEENTSILHSFSLEGNSAPDSPSNPSPSNGSIRVSTSPTLSVDVSDPDGDTMNVTFYNASDNTTIGTDTGVSSGGTASITWNNLDNRTEYSWYAIADDGEKTTQSPTWTFKTGTKAKVLIGKGRDTYQLQIDSNLNIYGYINNEKVSTQVNKDFHHIVMTYNESYLKIYKDGKLKDSKNISESINTNSKNLLVGQKVNGTIDEARVWRRALTQSEIQSRAKYLPYKANSSSGNYSPVERFYTNKSEIKAMWHFDAFSGNTVEDSSGNNNGTLGNSSSFTEPKWSSGQFGNALKFDGNNDYVDVSKLGFSDDTSITISAWIKVNSDAGNTNNIFGFGNAGNANETCSIRTKGDGAFRFYFWGNGLNTSTDNYYGKWVHVTAVYDATNSKRYIYRDGTEVASDSPLDPNFQNGNYTIGGYNEEWFDGKIDEVRVYSRALTQTEIEDEIVPLTQQNNFTDTSAKDNSKPNEVSNLNSTSHSTKTWSNDTTVDFNWTDATDIGDNYYYYLKNYDDVGNENNYYNRSGLVSYWQFHEGSSGSADGKTTYDERGNDNDGTVYGANWTTGKYGSALDFDGNGDYVNVSDDSSLDPGTSDFTVSGWVKGGGSGDRWQAIVQKWTSGHAGWSLSTDNDNLAGMFWNSTGTRYDVFGSDVLDNNWHHVAAVFDRNNNLTLYVDGSFDASTNISGQSSLNLDNSLNLEIGRDRNTGDYYNGTIDEVRIYDRSLSSEEVKENYYRAEIKSSEVKTGLDGYSIACNQNSSEFTGTTKNLSSGVENYTCDFSPGDNNYFHIRSVDKAGNWAPNSTKIGPFYMDDSGPNFSNESVDPPSGTAYAPGKLYTFEINWNDEYSLIDEVIFEFNGTNYTTADKVERTTQMNLTRENITISCDTKFTSGNFSYDVLTVNQTLTIESGVNVSANETIVNQGGEIKVNGDLCVGENCTFYSDSPGSYSSNCGQYRAELTDLPANEGGYTYRWYANDTLGNWNSTSNLPYTINKDDPISDMYINLNASEVSYPTVTNATGWSTLPDNQDLNFKLRRNGSQVEMGDPASQVTTLSPGTYDYTYYTAGGENYTQAETGTVSVTVTKSQCDIDMWLNGQLQDPYHTEPITYGTTANATATINIDQDPNWHLYRNGTPAVDTEPTTDPVKEINDLPADLYNYTAAWPGTENYSSCNFTAYLRVGKASPELNMTIKPDSTVKYPNETTVMGNITKGDQSAITNLTLDGDNVSSGPGNQSHISTLAGGTHTYNYTYYESENYSSTSTERILTVIRANTSTDLFLNGSSSDEIYNYSQTANFTVALNVSNKTVKLDTNISGWDIYSNETPLYNYTTMDQLGTFNITGYFEGDENYSSSSKTYYATVQDVTPPKYSQNSTNSTLAGEAIEHRLKWTDNAALSGYIFQFCNGTWDGTNCGGPGWTNSSFYSWTGEPSVDWSNITKVVNSTVGAEIAWKVYAKDTSNNWNSSLIYTYETTDVTPPKAYLGTNPIDNYNTSSDTLTFDLKCTDNKEVDSLELWGNWSGGWHANKTNSTISNNTWWNVTVSGIPDGSWKWGAWCNDSAGNEDWSDSNRTFLVDTTDPTISYTSPTPSDGGRSTSNSVTINTTVSDNEELDMCILEWEGTNRSVTPTSGYCSWTNNSLQDGTNYTFKMFVNDSVGNYNAETERTFRENEEPSISSVNVTPESPQTTDDLNCTVYGWSDPDGDSEDYFYEWYRDGILNLTVHTSSSSHILSSGNTTKGETWNCTVTPWDGYENGTAKWDNETIQVTVPTVNLTTPMDEFVVNENISFEGKASASIDLKNATFYWNYTGSWIENGTHSLSGTSTSFEFNRNELSEGTYKWNVEICDVEDACDFASQNFTVTVDKTNPGIEFVPPTDQDGENISRDWSYVNVSVFDQHNVSSFIDFDRSLKGYWSMDSYNSSGIKDDSTYSNFGMFNGGLGTDNITHGPRGKALEFDGSDDYVNCGNDKNVDFSHNDFTWEVWFKHTKNSATGWNDNLMQNGPDGPGWDPQIWFSVRGPDDPDPNSLLFGAGNGTDHVIDLSDTNHNYNDSMWHHAAVSVDRDGFAKLYVDGNKEDSQDISNLEGDDLVADSNTYFYIGSGSNGRIFNGTIDDVRIYDRALSPQEINASYYTDTEHRLYNNFTSLSEGQHSFYAYSRDEAGNVNQTGTRTIEVDTEAPQITIDNPENTTYGYKSITLNLTTSEQTESCWWNLDPDNDQTVGNETMPGSDQTYWEDTINVSQDGSYHLKTYCNDSAGNVGFNDTITFTVSTIDISVTKTIDPSELVSYEETSINVTTRMKINKSSNNITTFNITDEVPYDFEAPQSTDIKVYNVEHKPGGTTEITNDVSINVTDYPAQNHTVIRVNASNMSETSVDYLEENDTIRIEYKMNSSKMPAGSSRAVDTNASVTDTLDNEKETFINKTIQVYNVVLRGHKKTWIPDYSNPQNISVKVSLKAIGGAVSDIYIADYLPQGANIYEKKVKYFNETTDTNTTLKNVSDYLLLEPQPTTLPQGMLGKIYNYNFTYNYTHWSGNLFPNDTITIQYNLSMLGGGQWVLPGVVSGYDPTYKKHIKTEMYSSAKVPSFDVSMDLITDKVKPGESVKALLRFVNVGGPKAKVDVFADYSIKTMQGDVIKGKSETLAVTGKKEEMVEMEAPEEIKPGTYTLESFVSYTGREALTTATFEIEGEKKPSFIMRHLFKILLIAVILLVVLLYLRSVKE